MRFIFIPFCVCYKYRNQLTVVVLLQIVYFVIRFNEFTSKISHLFHYIVRLMISLISEVRNETQTNIVGCCFILGFSYYKNRYESQDFINEKFYLFSLYLGDVAEQSPFSFTMSIGIVILN